MQATFYFNQGEMLTSAQPERSLAMPRLYFLERIPFF
jgi:hypothetical protein